MPILKSERAARPSRIRLLRQDWHADFQHQGLKEVHCWLRRLRLRQGRRIKPRKQREFLLFKYALDFGGCWSFQSQVRATGEVRYNPSHLTYAKVLAHFEFECGGAREVQQIVKYIGGIQFQVTANVIHPTLGNPLVNLLGTHMVQEFVAERVSAIIQFEERLALFSGGRLGWR